MANTMQNLDKSQDSAYNVDYLIWAVLNKETLSPIEKIEIAKLLRNVNE